MQDLFDVVCLVVGAPVDHFGLGLTVAFHRLRLSIFSPSSLLKLIKQKEEPECSQEIDDWVDHEPVNIMRYAI